MSHTSYRVLVTLLAMALCAATSWALPSSRILGGDDAVSGQFPYAASVRLDLVHNCGGSIISKKHILTAAHCVVDANEQVVVPGRVSVRVGSVNQFAGGKLLNVVAVNVHPNYDDLQFDIAVLTLASELTLSDKIAVIPIVTAAEEQPVAGAAVKVAGWGEQSSGDTPYKLQSSAFTVAGKDECLDAYADADESFICLLHSAKRGSCHGDAGNGAVYNNKLVAVSNFIVGSCGSRYPDVFANVAYYAAWIESQIS